MCTSPLVKSVERCFGALLPAFRGEMGGCLSSRAFTLPARSLLANEGHRSEETTDAEKEMEFGEFLKSGSGEPLTFRRGESQKAQPLTQGCST